VKIDINKIPLDGLIIEEQVNPSALDLETETVKFSGPVRIRAEVSKITNAVTVNLRVNGSMHLNCSRCLKECEIDLKKDLRLNYQVDKTELIIDTSTPLECHGERSLTIDLDQDIKEEIILDYPIKHLCNPDCKGLCHKCGKNLNEGGCSCAIT